MKIVKICIAILFALVLSGCLDKNISGFTSIKLNSEEEFESSNTCMFAGTSEILSLYWENHEIIDEATHTNVYIEYPQVNGMVSSKLETQVNSLLKNSVVPFYSGESVVGLNLDMKTSIEFFNDSLISVKYSGFGYYYGAKDVVDTLYAVNIDLKTASIINIHELFRDNFRECLNRDVFVYSGFDKSGEGKTIDPNSHEYGYINADETIVSEIFDNYDSNMTNEKYYFNEDKFNLIVKVPSGSSAYLELATDYNSLKKYMQIDNEFWTIFTLQPYNNPNK